MKQLLWIIIIVVVLGGAYYLWQGNSTDAPSESEGETAGDTMPVPGTDTPDTQVGGEAMEPGEGEDFFDALISYTDAGYEPSSTTIKRGQTVRFVNNSAEDTWPASAVHPTHSVYPEKTENDCLGSAFDACRGLRAAEFWEFTFNEPGEWRFHDHLHPSKTGVVIVE